LRHLSEQIDRLSGKDEAAVAAISSIIAEEQEHHDRSASLAQASSFWLKVLSPMVAWSTESVIWIGMHL